MSFVSNHGIETTLSLKARFLPSMCHFYPVVFRLETWARSSQVCQPFDPLDRSRLSLFGYPLIPPNISSPSSSINFSDPTETDGACCSSDKTFLNAHMKRTDSGAMKMIWSFYHRKILLSSTWQKLCSKLSAQPQSSFQLFPHSALTWFSVGSLKSSLSMKWLFLFQAYFSMTVLTVIFIRKSSIFYSAYVEIGHSLFAKFSSTLIWALLQLSMVFSQRNSISEILRHTKSSNFRIWKSPEKVSFCGAFQYRGRIVPSYWITHKNLSSTR